MTKEYIGIKQFTSNEARYKLIIQIKIPKLDIPAFCKVCAGFKSRGIYTEVFQDNKVVSGSSMLGLAMLDEDEPMYLMTRQYMSDDDIGLIQQWIMGE